MARYVDVEIRGLNAVLRALRAFPPQATAELRDEAGRIAGEEMMPAWQRAASSAGPWGGALASSVRVRRDRVPSVSIGYARRVFTGGASTIMVRYPSSAGRIRPEMPAAFGAGSDWLSGVGDAYKHRAMERWGDALERTVRRWNAGGVM